MNTSSNQTKSKGKNILSLFLRILSWSFLFLIGIGLAFWLFMIVKPVKRLFFRIFYKKEDIFSAILKGYLKRVKLLLQKGANLNWMYKDGWSALHRAIENNQVEMVKMLTTAQSDVNFRDRFFELTPLHN
ncbi:ankyrin repeat domain-containing protein [bacterium]|nr:MAG: ankyrin repeat domain-containing protein [bacterium]